MTNKERQLLLIDLCARQLYGVIVDYKENEFETPHWKITTIYPETFDGWIGYDRRVGTSSESGSRPFNIGEVKPYLRPMSSMTEEEKTLMATICLKYANGNVEGAVSELSDFYNSRHFDYRGLIPMGLALEAPKDMYKTE